MDTTPLNSDYPGGQWLPIIVPGGQWLPIEQFKIRWALPILIWFSFPELWPTTRGDHCLAKYSSSLIVIRMLRRRNLEEKQHCNVRCCRNLIVYLHEGILKMIFFSQMLTEHQFLFSLRVLTFINLPLFPTSVVTCISSISMRDHIWFPLPVRLDSRNRIAWQSI